MNVKQALKLKNKLVEELNDMLQVAQLSNSIEVGNPRHYKVVEVISDATKKAEELAELKAKIHAANAPVYSLIFKMSEYKNLAKEIRAIPTDEGKVAARYSSSFEQKEVELNVKQIKEIVTNFEFAISAIQDELDLHNLTTEI